MTSTTLRIPAVRCLRCGLMRAPATTGLCVSCARPKVTLPYRHTPAPQDCPTIPAPAFGGTK